MFLTRMSNFVSIWYYLLFVHKIIFYAILYFKHLKFKHLINDIAINL